MTTTAYARNITWLLAAADRLEAEGNFALAAEARAEAALPTPPAPVRARVCCDSCGHTITSEKRLDKYDALGVDWALCARCERA